MSPSANASVEPVVIIGAGPAGLLLARYLQIHHVPCVIYEREDSPTARQQGGSLDLHDDTGLKALRETGLLDEASTMMRPEGEAMKIMDKDGKAYWDENTYPVPSPTDVKPKQGNRSKPPQGRPEIDRTDLRDLLLRSLEPNAIKWGQGVKSTRALSVSNYELAFYDGTTLTTSVLVGADGTFSKIRRILHEVQPRYSGVSMYDLMIPSANMTDELRNYVGVGGACILADSKAIVPQMNSGGKCKVYPALWCPEEWLDEHPLPDQGKREWIFNTLFDGWDSRNRALIMAADEDNVTPRKILEFPLDLSWNSDKTGVTVIGDAAHVMSPFAGEGVNQALADALALGKALVRAYTVPRPAASLAPFPLSLLPISPAPPEAPTIRTPSPRALHAALRRFEKRMMDRVRPYMIESNRNIQFFFGPGSSAAGLKSAFIWMIATEVSKMVIRAPWVLVSSLWAEED